MTNENSGGENPYADKIFTVSNILSLSRIVIVIPIIYFLDLGNTNPRHNLTALAFMIIGGLTDTFDGQLARKMNQITNFGKVVDPIADKIGMAAILLFLAISRDDFPVWFLVLALIRDILIFSAGFYIKKKYAYLFTSNMLGKITITVVALMVTVYVVKDVFHIEEIYLFLLWISTVLLVTSFYVYILRLRKFLRSHKNT
ncbi:CDP-alcohol phosphatidyltransferase family protein [bacterium]|nr:CDP-alcohol phosphatidyltransferase family protein [bacterium]